jgi:hypothetical protein
VLCQKLDIVFQRSSEGVSLQADAQPAEASAARELVGFPSGTGGRSLVRGMHWPSITRQVHRTKSPKGSSDAKADRPERTEKRER